MEKPVLSIKNCQRLKISDNFCNYFLVSSSGLAGHEPPQQPEQPSLEDPLALLIKRDKVKITKAIAKTAINKSIILIFVTP